MAAAAGNFKRILQVLEKWPVDKNKAGGRDLGEFLRRFVTDEYKSNNFEQNLKYWDQQYLAIQRLVNNEHKNKYKRCLSSNATNLTAEQCNLALSNEFLEEINKEEESFWKRLLSIRPKNN